MRDRTTRGIRAARFALGVNAVLVAVKVTAGLLGSSYALVADGVESTLDIFSSLIVWRALAVAERHPDERYHFGYGKDGCWLSGPRSVARPSRPMHGISAPTPSRRAPRSSESAWDPEADAHQRKISLASGMAPAGDG